MIQVELAPAEVEELDELLPDGEHLYLCDAACMENGLTDEELFQELLKIKTNIVSNNPILQGVIPVKAPKPPRCCSQPMSPVDLYYTWGYDKTNSQWYSCDKCGNVDVRNRK